MPASPNLKHLIWLSVAVSLVCISCSKPHNDPGNTTNTQANHQLQPFTAQIVFTQPDRAVVSWTASKDSLNDTIWYKVLLAGKIVDSNLTRLNDTLKNISPGLSYEGSVIAYNRYNDTISASFKLSASSKAYAYFFMPIYNTGIQCQDLYTNQRVWSSMFGGGGGSYSGTPLIVNDTLFANYDNVYNVLAINATTGNLIWRSPQMMIKTNPYGPTLGDGGPVYYNGKLYIGNQYSITCLNSSTGQILWSNADGSEYYTVPVVDGGKVFVGTYKYYYTGLPDTFAFKAIDANTGATIWKHVKGTQSNGYPVACNGVLIYNDLNGDYYAFDENTGTQLWMRAMSNFSNSPVHYNNLLICWSSGQLYGLNISTGAITWQTHLTQTAGMGDPFVSHDTIFVSRTLTSSSSGNPFQLFAVRAGTGEILWMNTTRESAASNLWVAGGRMYLQSTDYLSLNVYSTKDGSFIQNVNAKPGAIVENGVAYYTAKSGMVQ
jgi:outer membrane protein assembly factor BamB